MLWHEKPSKVSRHKFKLLFVLLFPLSRDVLTLGKFSVNLFNVPLHDNYAKRMATVIQLLVDKAHYLPLTVENLNKVQSNSGRSGGGSNYHLKYRSGCT